MRTSRNCTIVIAVLISTTSSVLAQTVRFVDARARPRGDGLSWATAYTDVFDALDEAATNQQIDQIWVAAGTYTPDRGQGARTDTFRLTGGTSLYGGFAGTETDLAQRDIPAAPTILSGDLDGDDILNPPADDRPDLSVLVNRDDNAQHVISGSDLADPVTIDGFIIRGGNADFDGAQLLGGGGMYLKNCEVVVRRCVFEENRAGTAEPDIGGFGGALFLDGGMLTIRDCVFTTNRGMNGGAIGLRRSDADHAVMAEIADTVFAGNFSEWQTGGAIWSSSVVELTVLRCRFESNFAQYGGAVMDQDLVHPSSKLFRDCRFVGNRCAEEGGAVWHIDSGPVTDETPIVFDGCRFTGNVAENGNGGALQFRSTDAMLTGCSFFGNQANIGGGVWTAPIVLTASPSGSLTIVNGVFSGNSANRGGGVGTFRCQEFLLTLSSFANNSATQFGGGVFIEQTAETSSARINNTVLWNNQAAGVSDEFGQIIGGFKILEFSLVQGLRAAGSGNIDADPLFVDADGADDTPGTADDDLRPQPGSPAIDAGNNLTVPGEVVTDADDQPRFIDVPAAADCPQAPGQCGDVPVVDIGAFEFQIAANCAADLDRDGTVGIDDFLSLLGAWGLPGHPADLDSDGVVGVTDFLLLLGSWGPCP